MTTDELFIELEDKPKDTVIVTLKYKYDFEENYTIENQILEYDGRDDTYVWLNDWYEGQTYIEVLGYTFLSDVDTLTCYDCISRQATVERLYKIGEFMNEKCIGSGSPYVMAALFIKDNKDEFPSVTPQPKTGKWLAKSFHEVYCDHCGFEFDIMKTEFIDKMYYCPNCGAKMETEVKNNG